MKKIDLLNYANTLDINATLELIKEFCRIIKQRTNIDISFTENIDKNFVYEFKTGLKELDKIFLGKNRYIYFQKEIEWDMIDFIIDYTYSEFNNIISINHNIALCELLLSWTMVSLQIMYELEEKNEC